MKDKYKVIVGFELETEYNQKVLGELDINAYHSNYWSKFLDNKYFKCESDASLDNNKFDDTVEIISAPVELNKINKVLKSFQKSVFKKAKKRIEFHKAFNLNKSCGCHVHISILDCNKKYRYEIFDNAREEVFDFVGQPYIIKDLFTNKFLNSFREKLHKNVKKHLKKVYPKFHSNYFRDYAQEMEDVDDGDRCSEFNFATDERCEFRSFNLNGVKTWREFFKMFEILKKSMYETLYEKEKPQIVKKPKIKNVIKYYARIKKNV